jgi:hypothetical protein
MKNLLCLTLIMFICLSYVQLTDKKITNNKNNKLKVTEKKELNQLESKANLRKVDSVKVKADPPKADAPKADAPKVDAPKIIYINSVGHEVDTPMIVDKAPYKLDRCDQIVALEAEFVPDLEDFTVRKKAYFTITAFHLNRFETKDIAKLDQSLIFTNSRVKPSEPQGAENCLLIDGGNYEKTLLICLKNREEFDNLRALLDTLEDCRAGKLIGKAPVVDNNSKSDKPALSEVVKKCGLEEGTNFNPDVMLKSSEEKKKEEKSPTGEVEFWIPAGDVIPGAPKEKNAKK